MNRAIERRRGAGGRATQWLAGMRSLVGGASVWVAVVVAGTAVAGVVDTPLPQLEAGKPTLHLYSVPGVIKVAGVVTMFSCTSMDTSPIRVGVEVFGAGGGAPLNDPVATSLVIPVGGTVIFATGPTIWLTPDSVVSLSDRGSGRILATSKKVACSAFLTGNDATPGAMTTLTIIKKTTQKAAN